MSLCFTRDAKTLVSLGDEGTIRFWNIAEGKEIAKLPTPPMKGQSLKGNLAFLAVSPDGKNLAVSLPDGSTRLLDAAGQELRRLRSSEQMNALVFSPNGKALFTGGNLVESWNVSDAEPITLVKQSRNPLRALSLSPDGKIAACADSRDRLRWVEIGTGKVQLQREMLCRAGIAFSPKGRLFAAAPGDNTIALWDVAPLSASENPLRSEPAVLLRCKGKVDAFVFSPDGKRLATVEEGKCARIYEVASRKAVRTFKPSGRKVYAVAFSADGKLLATIGEPTPLHGAKTVPQSVGLWDTFTGKELPIGEDLRQTANTVVFHPNGKVLAALHLPDIAKDAPQSGFMPIGFQAIPVDRRMETIRLWSTGFTREKFRFEDPIHRKNAEGAGAWIIGWSQAIAAAFSPDGWLFAAPGPGGIVLFETATGRPRQRLAGHLNEITALAFTPDGKTLVSTSQDSTLLIWDVTGLRTNAKLPGGSEEFWALLTNTDAEKAGRAIFAMVDAPAASLALLRKRLNPVSVSQAGLRKLIADLDDSSFLVRQKAARELAILGPLAETALTKQLQAKPSLEASRRIKELLAGIRSKRPLTDQIRAIRAVEVLERIGSREADALLAELAAGSEGAYLTDHAREAVARAKRRSVEEPAKKREP
jgi:WD40 repeat protein